MFIEALILIYYKKNLKTVVKTNLSYYVSNKVVFQYDLDRLLYLIIFFKKNLNQIKFNCEIYNEKLLAIIKYFK